MAENRKGRASGEDSKEVRPPSRVQQVTQRSDGTPSPEEMALLAYASSIDVANRVIKPKQVYAICRGVSTVINVAKNLDPLIVLNERMEQKQEIESKEEAISRLEEELNRLKNS